uniref:Epoxide hydrolase n=1 Tax=Steinernema glaseri TaxID=37863 RepID=A0A1I7Y992_9BILA
MERLGKPKFFTQGGDWGSAITTNLAKLYPDNVLGAHLNMFFVMPHSNAKTLFLHVLGHLFPSWAFGSPTNHMFSMKTFFLEAMKESGYMHIQATKPDTVGVSLNDSPLGLAAYILEKFSTWTNNQFRSLPDGGITKSRRRLLRRYD